MGISCVILSSHNIERFSKKPILPPLFLAMSWRIVRADRRLVKHTLIDLKKTDIEKGVISSNGKAHVNDSRSQD
jgi:hypothetical protein